ncbi:MAG: cation transporter dimerization domain-containing protein, partial [Bdellovibrionia bacterium]
QLPAQELEKITALVDGYEGPHIIETHDLRTRKSGATRHIDFHLVVCGHMTVDASHSVCDDLEVKISEVFPRASVNIHVEPCEKGRAECQPNCPVEFRRKKKI